MPHDACGQRYGRRREVLPARSRSSWRPRRAATRPARARSSPRCTRSCTGWPAASWPAGPPGITMGTTSCCTRPSPPACRTRRARSSRPRALHGLRRAGHARAHHRPRPQHRKTLKRGGAFGAHRSRGRRGRSPARPAGWPASAMPIDALAVIDARRWPRSWTCGSSAGSRSWRSRRCAASPSAPSSGDGRRPASTSIARSAVTRAFDRGPLGAAERACVATRPSDLTAGERTRPGLDGLRAREPDLGRGVAVAPRRARPRVEREDFLGGEAAFAVPGLAGRADVRPLHAAVGDRLRRHGRRVGWPSARTGASAAASP